MLLHSMIDEAAQRDPDATAIRCDGAALSYGQLTRRANGLARTLLETGLRPRGRVAVLLDKGLDVPAGFYGALAAGGALVPIDPRSPVGQITRILCETGATHVVTQTGKADLLRAALADCPDLSQVIGLESGEGIAAHCLPWAAVEQAASDEPPPVKVLDIDPAYILHTSGSTGKPKLILHTHRSAMSFLDWAVAEYSLTSEDRLSNHSSHHTCFATFDYYAAARAGATTVVLTPAVMMMPGSLSALLEAERVSVWYSVPTALVQLSLRGDLEQRDLSALRWVLFAGETFPEKYLRRVMRQLPRARFSHVYGSTEVNVCTRYHLPPEAELSAPLPIGKPCSNATVQVVDDDLQPVPDGGVGELLVRGSTVMSGYWGEPRRNEQVFVRRRPYGGMEEVYFRTGDRVRVLPGGDLTFVTRADRQVKVRGHRVELEEVETALLSLDSVEEAATFAVPDAEGSSTVWAAVVARSVESSVERQIRADLAQLLPRYAVPSEIALLEALPRTPTNKVDRHALRARLVEGGVGGD